MRCISYAGDRVTTTSEVASALLRLAVGIASSGQVRAVSIPIAMDRYGGSDEAELIVGVGISVLSSPTPWSGPEPDFRAACIALHSHPDFPQPIPDDQSVGSDVVSRQETGWDPDLHGYSSDIS